MYDLINLSLELLATQPTLATFFCSDFFIFHVQWYSLATSCISFKTWSYVSGTYHLSKCLEYKFSRFLFFIVTPYYWFWHLWRRQHIFRKIELSCYRFTRCCLLDSNSFVLQLRICSFLLQMVIWRALLIKCFCGTIKRKIELLFCSIWIRNR